MEKFWRIQEETKKNTIFGIVDFHRSPSERGSSSHFFFYIFLFITFCIYDLLPLLLQNLLHQIIYCFLISSFSSSVFSLLSNFIGFFISVIFFIFTISPTLKKALAMQI